MHLGHRSGRSSPRRSQCAGHPGPARTGRRQRGFTLPEVLFGMLVMATVAAVMVGHLTINLQSTVSERDRLFAFGKAQAILAEIQSHVDRGEAALDGVDALDDGVVNKDTLTIAQDEDGELVLPDHVLSGNWRRQGEWVWSRRITVQPFPGVDNRNVRYVTVRMFQRDLDGVVRETADLSAVVNAPGAAFPTTQVFDLYLLAIENIPGWWVFMDSIRPFVEATITDLETRNPGLEVRTHWITKASFGRSQSYRPYINDQRDSLQPIPDVYFYPGRMPAGQASTHYYVPSNIMGHVAKDGVDANGYSLDLNPYPYALCDFFNHAMRYPDELALWKQRVDKVKEREAQIKAARMAGNVPPPALDDMSKEPTLRLFLEDLYSNPQKYKNALVVNLHGELLPMPALRNYSDAAKDALAMPEVRVVTHPEKLRTARDPGGVTTEAARFRVYAYTTNVAPGPQTVPAIALDVVGMDLTNPATPAPDLRSDVQLQNLRGGVAVGGTNAYQPFRLARVAGDPLLVAGEMYYSADYVTPPGGTPFTRILLYNTPCVAGADSFGHGLATTGQLYGMAYVPSPNSSSRDFSKDLFATGTGPKNTARWTLQIPSTSFRDRLFRQPDGSVAPDADVVLGVRTRIWTGAAPDSAGTMWPTPNAPDNLSTTYTWWCDSPEDVPITERSQFQGDPRHCPYRDLMREQMAGDPLPVFNPDFPNGYNWFFTASANQGGAFPGLVRQFDMWRGKSSSDMPRLLELLRKGLVRSDCVYTTLTGFSYYYLGIGNDIGYDAANGYPNSIPCDQAPFGRPGTSGFVNNITGTRTFVRQGTSTNTYWWSMPWLGELYPDAMASQWLARGNLPAGSSSTTFRHENLETVHNNSIRRATGTTLAGGSQQRLQDEGCTSFFNTGTASSTFHHVYSSGTGNVTATGLEIANNYNFNMPTTPPISRPFGIARSDSGTVGNEFAIAPYSNERFSTLMLRTYYTHPTGATGSGLVQMTDRANTASAFVVVNGIDRTVESGSNFIAKYAVLSLVHSFFEAGNTAVAHRIQQPPRVEIVQPTDITELVDPNEIDITVATTWKRWDGLPYTATNSVVESEAELDYVLTYSNDGGVTWRHVFDNTPATPGERPANALLLVPDAGTGNENYRWAVPEAQFPQGSYYLRVDCFRRGAPIHFSYHQTKLFVQR